MKFTGWKYGVDESAVENHGDRYPYIESPEGKRLWLADLDPRQCALAERLVEAANLGEQAIKNHGGKVSGTRMRGIVLKSQGRRN